MNPRLINFLFLICITALFSNCQNSSGSASCIPNSYIWASSSPNPDPAMIVQFNEILNDVNNLGCNPDLDKTCNTSDINFSENTLGGSANANFVIDDYDSITDHILFCNGCNGTFLGEERDINVLLNKVKKIATDNAPWCSCQSYRGKIVNYDFNYLFISNGGYRRFVVTVTYQCCRACR